MGNTAAIFDLDLTITNKDTFRCFLKDQYIFKQQTWHLLPRFFWYGILRKSRLISLQKFKEYSLIFLIGKTDFQIKQIGAVSFESHLNPLIRHDASSKIRWHKARGDYVFIATSCPDIYVNLFSEYLNCDGYVCSELSYNKNGFSGNFKGKDCIGLEKLKKLNKILNNFNISLEASYFYSDSYSDLPLFERVGKPVAVNPDSKLQRFAKDRNWTIEVW